ncbi:MAG: hypothetical protein MSG64_17830 [Pyrinomonadaceae bacterium MAG19_C2-C3]|nr:hypothetical protein [Pyrinomonadaceae bacterium MAG19_C2-C3]
MQITVTKIRSASQTLFGSLINDWKMLTAALVCVPLLFTACASESPKERAAEVGGVTAAQVINNPNAYVGKTVTVSGDVEEIHSPRAFNMDSGASLGELLVLGREPFPQVPDGGNRGYVINDTATVTGTVRMLVTAEIERELGWDLQPELEAEFNAKPVLVAQTVGFKSNPNRSQMNTNANTNGNANMNANMNSNTNGNMSASNADPITDMLVIVTPVDRTPLVGRRVRFTDVKVQKMVGDRGFFIGANDNQRFFVRLTKPLDTGRAESIVNVNQGQVRTLGGVIRQLPDIAEVRGQWGLNAQEITALERDRVYLEADTIELVEKNP